MQCPTNAFVYNTTQCACNAGYVFNATTRGCELFSDWGQIEVATGIDYSINLPETIFSFDSIKKLTQSQAVFLEATALMLLSWLLFCFFIRLVGPLGDGRSLYFKIRWWISRLDVCFATRHWLDDQKVVRKRKTELGGAFSIASWILFIGLFAALLYQIISRRSVEVHNVTATNAPDLANFLNDFEFNITTVSSMSCSHLRGLGTLVAGYPGDISHRVLPLSTFSNYSCINTTKGPTISMRCTDCQILRDIAYVSWQFVDLPNNPATAVGFLFKLTARNRADEKRLSYVSGTLKNGSHLDDRPTTFRGKVPNVLKFNFFPRLYHNMHDLKLIQPLLHEFLPGSSFRETSQLQASLQSSSDGMINTTLYFNFLSDYIVEIDRENVIGPVSFLADLGGLYCISIGIFFYLLLQCEYRIKKLRNEDSEMRKVRSRRKAQDHWKKLRKYVMYTWAPCSLDDKYDDGVKNGTCCAGVTICKNGSLHKRRLSSRLDDISFSRNASFLSEKRTLSQHNLNEVAKPGPKEPASDMEENSLCIHNESIQENTLSKNNEDCKEGHQVQEKVLSKTGEDGKEEHPGVLHPGDDRQTRTCSAVDSLSLPPPPSLELKAIDEVSVADLQQNLQNLYEYNSILTEKLIAAQSMLNALTRKNKNAAANNPK